MWRRFSCVSSELDPEINFRQVKTQHGWRKGDVMLCRLPAQKEKMRRSLVFIDFTEKKRTIVKLKLMKFNTGKRRKNPFLLCCHVPTLREVADLLDYFFPVLFFCSLSALTSILWTLTVNKNHVNADIFWFPVDSFFFWCSYSVWTFSNVSQVVVFLPIKDSGGGTRDRFIHHFASVFSQSSDELFQVVQLLVFALKSASFWITAVLSKKMEKLGHEAFILFWHHSNWLLPLIFRIMFIFVLVPWADFQTNVFLVLHHVIFFLYSLVLKVRHEQNESYLQPLFLDPKRLMIPSESRVVLSWNLNKNDELNEWVQS